MAIGKNCNISCRIIASIYKELLKLRRKRSIAQFRQNMNTQFIEKEMQMVLSIIKMFNFINDMRSTS